MLLKQPEPGENVPLAPPLQRRFRDVRTGRQADSVLELRSDHELDPGGLSDLLAWGYQSGSRTPLRGVQRVLKPWHLSPPDIDPRQLATVEERADRLWELLKDAIGEQLPSDGPVRVSLSGGLDSRAILAAAASVSQGEGKASTFGDPDCADLMVAQLVAARVGLTHDRVRLPRDGALTNEERVWVATGGTGGPHSAPGAPTDVCWSRDAGLMLSGMSGDVIWGDTVQPGPTPARRLKRLGFRYQEPRWDEELPRAPEWVSESGARVWRNLWTRQQGGTWNGVLPRLTYCRVVPIPWHASVLGFCLALGEEDRHDRRLLRTLLRRHAPAISDLAVPPVRGAHVHDLDRAFREASAWRESLNTWVRGARSQPGTRAFEVTGLRR
ncbi:MAG TPA: hypothetical protein DIU15_07925, partial [Deltaproteobacteria bacterium]|nr:hypothetical protein [Deltaproteobacteria bacterium]